MLQASVPNVSSVFFKRMLQVCLFGCFTHILQVFYPDVGCVLQWSFQVFSCAFCKCFRQMFELFHLFLDSCCNVSSRYFKSRSDVAAGEPLARLVQLLGHCRPGANVRAREAEGD